MYVGRVVGASFTIISCGMRVSTVDSACMADRRAAFAVTTRSSCSASNVVSWRRCVAASTSRERRRIVQVAHFERVQRLVEDADLIDRAVLELVHLEALAEREPEVAAVQAVTASRRRASCEVVVQDFGVRAHAIDVEHRAGRTTRTIVGRADVQPLAGWKWLHRLHGEHVVRRVVDEIELQPVLLERRLHSRCRPARPGCRAR